MDLLTKAILEYFESAVKGGKDEEQKDEKQRAESELIKTYADIINSHCSSGITDLLIENTKEAAEQLALRGLKAYRVSAKLKYRAKVGVSEYLLPLEAGLHLHPVYFVPFFPGSSVKGAMRNIAYRYFYHKLNEVEFVKEDEAERLAEELVKVLFGDAGDQRSYGISAVEVFDAFPRKTNVCVVPDIITPHYHKGGKPVESEFEAEPIPIKNFSIACDTVFEFFLAVDMELVKARLKHLKEREKLDNLKDLLKEIGREIFPLKLLLTAFEVGLGAKTTRGYGRFSLLEMREFRVR